MENLEWYPFFYNGIETNIEVTRCGRVRKILTYWTKTKKVKKEFFLKRDNQGYYRIWVRIKNNCRKKISVHQIVAHTFLDYKFIGHKNVVDHINSNKLDNNLNNLKVVSNRENSSREKCIKSGLPVGVHLNKRDNKYKSGITINNKLYYLGSFCSIEQASNAYNKTLNEFKKNGIVKRENIGNRLLPTYVYYNKRINRFYSIIYINKKPTYLGSYVSPKEARNAYDIAKNKMINGTFKKEEDAR